MRGLFLYLLTPYYQTVVKLSNRLPYSLDVVLRNRKNTGKNRRMKFETGKSGNPKGRPKGSKNKPVRTKIESLIKRNITKIEQEIDTTTPERRRSFLVDLSAALSITQIAQQDDVRLK